MITDGNEKFNYLSVLSMSRLIMTGAKYKRKHYVCNYCLYPFPKQDLLKEHTIICRQHQSQQIRYPTLGKDDVLKFTKFHYQFPVPFVIYADFECFLEKNDADHSLSHVPSSFCALTVNIFEEHNYKLHCYSGKNVMDKFYSYMNQEEQRIYTVLNQNNAMIELTEDQNIIT